VGLTLAEIIAALAEATAKAQVAADALIVSLEAISPESIKGTEEAVRLALDAELQKITVTAADLTGALASAQAVILSGKGPTAGGADATLA
jgi:hypothetical protein